LRPGNPISPDFYKEAFANISLRFYAGGMDLTSITPTPQALKALTHPVRLRMLGLLRLEGPATATQLASRLGLNSGATSYHLRQLAQHGFVVDDDERGNARDRWWKAAHRSTQTAKTTDDPAARETLEAYLQSVAVVMTEQLQRAIEELPLVPEPWARASTFSDWVIRLTPARAQALVEALAGVLRDAEGDTEDEGEQFVVQLSAFPLPGHVTEGVAGGEVS
jgi:DNA-binding transcriptional ArsR family regulator